MSSRGSQASTSKRRRNTGGSGTKSISPRYIDIKEVLDSAKVKFESDQRQKSVTTVSSPGQAKSEDGKDDKKSVSAPASPNKSLTVMLPSEQPTKRARLMRSSMSPKGRRSTLLMTAATTTEVKSTGGDKSPNSKRMLLNDSNQSKKVNEDQSKKVSKGVSMNEVIR